VLYSEYRLVRGEGCVNGLITFLLRDGLHIPIGDSLGAKAIANWLGNDLQYSKGYVEEWLTRLATLASRPGYQGTGNAFSVFSTGHVVLLENEYVEDQKVCASIDSVSQALTCYRDFLDADNPSQDVCTYEIPVSYLEEGPAARDHYQRAGGTFAASE